jgi:hypothetical protein
MFIFSIWISSFLFFSKKIKQQNFEVEFQTNRTIWLSKLWWKMKGKFILKQEIAWFFSKNVFISKFFIIYFSIGFPRSRQPQPQTKGFFLKIQSSIYAFKKYKWFFNFDPPDFLIFLFFLSLSMHLFNCIFLIVIALLKQKGLMLELLWWWRYSMSWEILGDNISLKKYAL